MLHLHCSLHLASLSCQHKFMSLYIPSLHDISHFTWQELLLPPPSNSNNWDRIHRHQLHPLVLNCNLLRSTKTGPGQRSGLQSVSRSDPGFRAPASACLVARVVPIGLYSAEKPPCNAPVSTCSFPLKPATTKQSKHFLKVFLVLLCFAVSWPLTGKGSGR